MYCDGAGFIRREHFLTTGCLKMRFLILLYDDSEVQGLNVPHCKVGGIISRPIKNMRKCMGTLLVALIYTWIKATTNISGTALQLSYNSLLLLRVQSTMIGRIVDKVAG